MNDGRDVPLSHRFPHPAASASIKSPVNTTTQANLPSGEIQVRRSPQPLSLRVDGLNAITVPHGGGNANEITYIESSDRGSDTSVDGRQPEIQSSSTITDSFPSMPCSLAHDGNRPMELISHKYNAASLSQTEQQLLDSQRATQTSSVDGDITMGEPDILAEANPSNGLLSPHLPTQLSPQSAVDLRRAQGQKRTATGEIKPVLPHHPAASSGVNGAARRRSKSTGSPAHGSRIAQLSVHIRTRLSYAAAQIEKSRQSRVVPTGRAQQPSSMSPPAHTNEQSYRNGINSVAGSNPTSHPQHHPNQTSSTDTIHRSSHHRSQSALTSPTKLLPIPKLAPPADIIASHGEAWRRRPNPNAISKPSHDSPPAQHRRHHSHQETSMARLYTSTSAGTTSLQSTAPTFNPNGFLRPDIQSQNSAMEQDAIETLLFMSSPENSGYHSSPRPLQGPTKQSNFSSSTYALKNGPPHDRNPLQRGKTDRGLESRNLVRGLEAHAGDEIDRILDQIESDSDD